MFQEVIDIRSPIYACSHDGLSSRSETVEFLFRTILSDDSTNDIYWEFIAMRNVLKTQASLRKCSASHIFDIAIAQHFFDVMVLIDSKTDNLILI